MIARITKAYKRHYRDNGQTTIYVEWVNTRGAAGRTEGAFGPCRRCGGKAHASTHMLALLARAEREGVPLTNETW